MGMLPFGSEEIRITLAYKRKLQERKQWEVEEKRKRG